MLTFDTPAHVQLDNHIENGIVVQGGSNYDLSRGGVATPIVRVPDPLPVMPPAVIVQPDLARTPYPASSGVPATQPTLSLAFSRNSKVLDAEARAVLVGLPKGARFVVAAHSSPGEAEPAALAKARAKAVAGYLKGKRVAKAVSFSDTLPLSINSLNAEKNARVEIFALEPAAAPVKRGAKKAAP